MEATEYKGRGRPKKTDIKGEPIRTPADRSHMTNISIPKDVRDQFNEIRQEMSDVFGFMPSQAQAITYLVNQYRKSL